MSKKQFLSILEKYLRKLPKNEIEEILQDYEEYFTIGVEEGKTESQIVEALGSPKQLAKELNAVNAIYMAEENKSIKSMYTALISIMGLSVINCIIILMSLFVLLILIPFILAYIIGVPIMILSPLILIIMGFVNGFSTIGTGEIFESIKGLIIGSILAVLGYYIGKSFVRLFIKYLKWNMSIAREKRL
ncbi:DUF1700 domain-containing protein [Lysinibacillus fusiformis]|uniref:HAAS signaling domain-containing protein n=1 Tax=Lysinibacillus fusiformis TaxID=28031 RepID=UPI002EB853E8|nr:DUF1700 domain-containing protein [Lysinibacillus fusiformis]